MNTAYIFVIIILFSAINYSQINPTTSGTDSLAKLKQSILDTNRIKSNTYDTNLKTNVVAPDTNTKKILVQDSTAHVYNEYRGLLNDDPVYNKVDPLWKPIGKVIIQNVLLNLV